MKPELTHRWWGGYLDVVHDFTHGPTRASFGPELGWALFGVDGGAVLQVGRGRKGVGASVRAVLTWSVIAVSAREGVLARERAHWLEFAFLLKFPIRLR